MSRNWTRYEGGYAGGWLLESFLGERDDRAFFLAHNGLGPKSVLMEVMTAGRPASDAALASWSLAKRFAHEHLLRVRAAGEEDLESGDRLVYAALDLPDDDVSEMVPRRPLEESEVRGMLGAAAQALEYLHEQGMSHGAMLPSNIFLVEGEWKLSVDTLAPGDAGRKAADIRQLGATLVWVLSGGTDAPTQTPSAESVAKLDLPFRDIALGCLNGSWSATQVIAALEGRYTPPEPVQDLAAAAAAPRQEPVYAAPARKARSNAWPVVTAGVAVLVLIVIYALNGRRSPDAAASSGAITPPQRTEHATAERAPVAARTASVSHGSADRDLPARAGSRPSWAVIAATYSKREGAEKRVHLIREKWHGFRPRVFPVEGEAGQYYVVLGSGLSRGEADTLRRRARSAGVAGDSYATKLRDPGTVTSARE